MTTIEIERNRHYLKAMQLNLHEPRSRTYSKSRAACTALYLDNSSALNRVPNARDQSTSGTAASFECLVGEGRSHTARRYGYQKMDSALLGRER